jgi:hypothetical protein
MRINGKLPTFLYLMVVSLAVGAFVGETAFAFQAAPNGSTSEISASPKARKLKFGPRAQKYPAAKIALRNPQGAQPATTYNTPPATICYDGYTYWNMANQWNLPAGAYTGQATQANAQTGGAAPAVNAGTVCYNANPVTSCYSGCPSYGTAPVCGWNVPAGSYAAVSNRATAQSPQLRIPAAAKNRPAQVQQQALPANSVTVCYSGCVPSGNGSVCAATPTCSTYSY